MTSWIIIAILLMLSIIEFTRRGDLEHSETHGFVYLSWILFILIGKLL